MTKVCVVAGYGPGISASFSRKFGQEGFSVALLARTASRLDAAVAGVWAVAAAHQRCLIRLSGFQLRSQAKVLLPDNVLLPFAELTAAGISAKVGND